MAGPINSYALTEHATKAAQQITYGLNNQQISVYARAARQDLNLDADAARFYDFAFHEAYEMREAWIRERLESQGKG